MKFKNCGSGWDRGGHHVCVLEEEQTGLTDVLDVKY